MNKILHHILLTALFLCSISLLQAYPEFSRLVSTQANIEDPYEYHIPSPIDCIAEPSLETPPPDLDRYEDLDLRAQSWVLETKQLKIQEYPYSFNPTIVRWHGSLLMAFRIRDARGVHNNEIGMIWLDENFDLKGSPYVLNVPEYKSEIPSKQQDPRLIVIGDDLYMVYSNVIKGQISPEVRRVYYTKVHFDGICFYTDPPEGILSFEGEKEQRWEKNWSPFEYNGELLLEQNLSPHRVMKPIAGTQSSETFSLSDKKLFWKWGVLRGGTQAYFVEGEYLSFFHSSISMRTVHSLGREIPHYFFGAYTFSATPPFNITRMSPRPIVGKGFYSGPPYKTWKPLRVVFPGGYVFDDRFIWIAYGRQDHEIWIAKLDRKKFLKSLAPVQEITDSNGK